MSDEPKPPALRLRPRKNPSADPATAAEPVAGAESAKLRLKPKLAGDAETQAPPASAEPRGKPRLSLITESDRSTASESPPAASQPPPAPPVAEEKPKPRLGFKLAGAADRPTVPPEGLATEPSPSESLPPSDGPAAPAKPKLKLSWVKKEENGEADLPPPSLPPPPPPPGLAPVATDFPPPHPPPAPGTARQTDGPVESPPVVTSIDGHTLSAPQFPPPPGVGSALHHPNAPATPAGEADDDDDDDDAADAPRGRRKRPEQTLVFKLAMVVVGLLVVGLIGGIGYYAYATFVDTTPMPVVEVPERPNVPAAGAPSSLPGKLIDKAKQAAAAHDEVTAETEAAMTTEAAANEAAAARAAALTSRPKLIIEDEPVGTGPVQIEPSAEFRTWVSEAKISGVREGSTPRAFINGILVRRGDVLQNELGIEFEGVDPVRNLVIFKDATGAIVGKKY